MPKLPDERQADNPWPEWPKVCKTDYGQEEAIALFGKDPRVYQTTVKEFIANEKGEVCKQNLSHSKVNSTKKPEETSWQKVAGSEYEVPVDLVLIAAGFLGSQPYVTKAFGLDLTERTNVKTEAGHFKTNVDKVFTAGDMHRGQSLVVWQFAKVETVQERLDTALMGYSNL